jgi:hypothetical protein
VVSGDHCILRRVENGRARHARSCANGLQNTGLTRYRRARARGTLSLLSPERSACVPPSSTFSAQLLPDVTELSLEDAMLDTWVEDTGVYLRLDSTEINPLEVPPPDQG